MPRCSGLIAGVVLGLLGLVPAAGAAQDARQLVQLPDMMQQHMLHNMRDHLMTINEIVALLAAGKYEEASREAEARLGMSSLGLHGAAHMARFMPKGMQDIGTNMHKAASRFAQKAQAAAVDHDLEGAIHSLSRVTAQCVACHESYRIR
jgi:hypothetical protein